MYTSKNMLFKGCAMEYTVPSLSVVVFSVGHYPYYVSSDLTLIKASKYWFSLNGFSRG
jgi:hypothetical protein